MSLFDSKLESLAKRSKDIVLLISEIENTYGSEHIGVIGLKDKFSRVQENLEYAKEYWNKEMKDISSQHLEYAERLLEDLNREISNFKGGDKKNLMPLLIASVVVLLIVMLISVVPTNFEFFDESPTPTIGRGTLGSPEEQLVNTLNAFSLTNQRLVYDQKILIQKRGSVYTNFPEHMTDETHYGYLTLLNEHGNQKMESVLVDYFKRERREERYYSRNGKYLCDRNYNNCGIITLPLTKNNNVYSKLNQVYDKGYEISLSEDLTKSSLKCTTIEIRSPLESRKEVEEVFGFLIEGEVYGEYFAEVCLNQNEGKIYSYVEMPSYHLVRPGGDRRIQHIHEFSLRE